MPEINTCKCPECDIDPYANLCKPGEHDFNEIEENLITGAVGHWLCSNCLMQVYSLNAYKAETTPYNKEIHD